jgi:hypothetical protein
MYLFSPKKWIPNRFTRGIVGLGEGVGVGGRPFTPPHPYAHVYVWYVHLWLLSTSQKKGYIRSVVVRESRRVHTNENSYMYTTTYRGQRL